MQINGIDVSNARYDQAVALLTFAGTSRINLVVCREHLLPSQADQPAVSHSPHTAANSAVHAMPSFPTPPTSDNKSSTRPAVPATAGFSSSAATHGASQATATAPSSFFQTTQTHTSNSLVDQFNASARHNRTPASTSTAAESLSAAAPRGAHYDGSSRYDGALVGKGPAERKTAASSSSTEAYPVEVLNA